MLEVAVYDGRLGKVRHADDADQMTVIIGYGHYLHVILEHQPKNGLHVIFLPAGNDVVKVDVSYAGLDVRCQRRSELVEHVKYVFSLRIDGSCPDGNGVISHLLFQIGIGHR